MEIPPLMTRNDLRQRTVRAGEFVTSVAEELCELIRASASFFAPVAKGKPLVIQLVFH